MKGAATRRRHLSRSVLSCSGTWFTARAKAGAQRGDRIDIKGPADHGLRGLAQIIQLICPAIGGHQIGCQRQRLGQKQQVQNPAPPASVTPF